MLSSGRSRGELANNLLTLAKCWKRRHPHFAQREGESLLAAWLGTQQGAGRCLRSVTSTAGSAVYAAFSRPTCAQAVCSNGRSHLSTQASQLQAILARQSWPAAPATAQMPAVRGFVTRAAQLQLRQACSHLYGRGRFRIQPQRRGHSTDSAAHGNGISGYLTAYQAQRWSMYSCRQAIAEMQARWWDVVRPTVNALYSAGGHVQRLLPLFVIQGLRGDNFASCLAGPGVFDHRLPTSPPARSMVRRVVEVVVNAACSTWRLLTLLIVFAPVLATAHLALQYGYRRAEWLSWLRRTLELAGPAFMKWGQWAATRADIFPPDMCTELAKLQTKAPAHSLAHTEHTVQHAFGLSIGDLFQEFEQQPVASGTIGQIHRAVLGPRGARNTGVPAGTRVAVKVRHPGVGEAIARDFDLMLLVAKAAALLPGTRRLRLEDSLRQFAAPLCEQVDLALEGRHLWQFNYNFRGNPGIKFPWPIYPLVTPEVLVETFEDGEHITRYVEMGPGAPHNARLAQLGSGAMLQMLLVDNLVHSDLHPGNILVRLEPPRGSRSLAHFLSHNLGLEVPAKWLQPSIVLLDVGMVTNLRRHEQQLLTQLFRAFSSLDGAGMATAALAFSEDKQTCPDPQAFIEDCTQLFGAMHASSSWEDTAYGNGAEAMATVLEVMRRHEVALPGEVCAVLVTTLVLEGWSSRLAPEHSVLEQVERLVAADSWQARAKSVAVQASQDFQQGLPPKQDAIGAPV